MKKMTEKEKSEKELYDRVDKIILMINDFDKIVLNSKLSTNIIYDDFGEHGYNHEKYSKK
jgi:hypothetical protein